MKGAPEAALPELQQVARAIRAMDESFGVIPGTMGTGEVAVEVKFGRTIRRDSDNSDRSE